MAVKPVENDKTAIAEINRPGAVFRVSVRQGASKLGLGSQNANLATYRTDGATCGVETLQCQELIQAPYVGQRRAGPDQP